MEVLLGDRIYLRPLSYEYLFAYLIAFTHEVRYILHVPDAHSEYLYLQDRILSKTFFYLLFDSDTDRLIGAVEIRDSHYRGQLYSWLHPDYWGRNYFQEALALVSTYYFRMTQLLYFTARVDITNQRSYRALKKAGFADYAYVQGAHGMQYELILTYSAVGFHTRCLKN